MDKCECGNEPELVWFYIKGVANRRHCFIKCKVCGKRTREAFKSESKAVKTWNERRELDVRNEK